jgi:hypothetical protein
VLIWVETESRINFMVQNIVCTGNFNEVGKTNLILLNEPTSGMKSWSVKYILDTQSITPLQCDSILN